MMARDIASVTLEASPRRQTSSPAREMVTRQAVSVAVADGVFGKGLALRPTQRLHSHARSAKLGLALASILVASVCLIMGPSAPSGGNDRGRGSARQRLV